MVLITSGWNPAAACTKLCDEPLVHTRGGFPVNQFAVAKWQSRMLSNCLGNFQGDPLIHDLRDLEAQPR